MNNHKSLQHSVNSVRINRHGGYYQPGCSYSAARIAECVDSYHSFTYRHSREPTVNEFMEAAKIGGKDIARKIIHNIKYGIFIPQLERGHRRQGALSLIDTSLQLQLELYHLYLDWPSRPIRSYKLHILQKYGLSISTGTISTWFNKNDAFKSVFVSKKCMFSELKYTQQNVLYYSEYKEYFQSIYHNNILFADEKSFIVNDLIKLKQRKDPLTGVAPDLLHPMGLNMRKRHNIMCAIRPFRTIHSNRTLRCVVTEENGTAQLFQRFIHLNCHTGFMVRGDIFVYDNARIHVSGDNSDLKNILRDVGIDAVTLPTYSPELNPIELIFNVMVQRFASKFNETELFNNDDVLQLLNSVVESITPDIIFSCYNKCGYNNFY